MSKRDFLMLFGNYRKRTSGNVWRINEFLHKEKMTVVPNFQGGYIDDEISLKNIDKVKIKKGKNSDDDFDPITRVSILKSASKIPLSIKRDANLEKAYHLMWHNGFYQLPVMNDERNILGIINWQSIAQGIIKKKKSDCVKDFMTHDYKILNEDVALFDAIKQVIDVGLIFVRSKNKIIRGPITPWDLNEEFIEQIEPFILLEQIENFIRLILHDKIILDDILKVIKIEKEGRKILSISDLTFGGYLRIFENNEMWKSIELPFDKRDFVENLNDIRKIRNDVMHFHPDKIEFRELELLRKTSKFLQEFTNEK